MRNPVVDGTNSAPIEVPRGAAGVELQDLEPAAIESSPAAAMPDEILTYKEAAQLLKISARTLERWTREGLIPYIRLPQRGRWSGVRFSRQQLLRWLRRRTVRPR